MSHAYPTIVADTPAEVDRWMAELIKRLSAWPAAEIYHDTGMVECRLMPIFPTREVGTALWWPIPKEITELDKALECLTENGLIYDRRRKSKVGYQRGLVVSLA